MSILLDVPHIAYKTWAINVVIKDKDGNRDYDAEKEFEDGLRETLSEFQYKPYHKHVR